MKAPSSLHLRPRLTLTAAIGLVVLVTGACATADPDPTNRRVPTTSGNEALQLPDRADATTTEAPEAGSRDHTDAPPVPEVVSESSTAVEPTVGSADTVVVLSNLVVEPPIVQDALPHLALQVFSGDVEEVLFSAAVSGDSTIWGSSRGYTPPQLGDRFRAYSLTTRSESNPLPDSDIGHLAPRSEAGQIVVLAHYIDSAREGQDYPAEWVGTVVAELGEDGNLSFGPSMDGLLSGAIPALRSAVRVHGVKHANDLETLVGWVEELTALRSPGEGFQEVSAETGPHSAAWREIVSASRPSLDQMWRNGDPAIRALDPEVTPEDVFEQLVELPLLVDISPEAAAVLEGYDVVIRTPTGVTHLAELATGDHPGQFFAMPLETVEVVITDDFFSGGGVTVAALEFADWESAVGIVVEIRSSLLTVVAGTGRSADYDVIVAADQAFFASKLAEHVSSQD